MENLDLDLFGNEFGNNIDSFKNLIKGLNGMKKMKILKLNLIWNKFKENGESNKYVIEEL